MESIMSTPKKGLGRGLSALIPSASEPRAESRLDSVPLEVSVERITPSPFQPRRAFDEAKIAELAGSIRNQGIIQPLVVRHKGDDFELIAGERRWRAAMKAGLAYVPVVIREASDHEALQLALVENLQREDLNPIEEANGYRRLQEEFHWNQEEMAEKVAKSRPAIANALDKAALLAEDGKTIEESALSEPGTRKIPDLFEIADSVARGLASRVLGQVDRALAFGRDPIELLAVEIIPVLRRLMIAATMLSHRRGSGEIASAIGASPTSGLVTRAIDGARRFGLERLKKTYTHAIELDESFKNGAIKERGQALGVLLLDLMG